MYTKCTLFTLYFIFTHYTLFLFFWDTLFVQLPNHTAVFFRRESGLILRCISSPPPPSPLAPLLSSSSPTPRNTSLAPLLTLLLLSLTLIPILFVYLKKRKVASIELEAVEVLEEDVFSPGSGVDVKRYEVVTGRTSSEGEHVVRSYANYSEGRVLWEQLKTSYFRQLGLKSLFAVTLWPTICHSGKKHSAIVALRVENDFRWLCSPFP